MLTWREALRRTNDAPTRSCERRHTAYTFHVGAYPARLSAKSGRAQREVRQECRREFARFLDATPRQLRLVMLRPVWFAPSARQELAGAHWLRCDVIAPSADSLMPLPSLESRRDRGDLLDAWAMCASTQPGDRDFARVPCHANDTWQALLTIDLPGHRYPHQLSVLAQERERCQHAVRQLADDPLTYEWGFEWPTKDQWRSGQRYAVCWAPSSTLE